MSIFKGKNVQLSQREELEYKFKASRSNLLFAVIVTAINLLLLLVGANFYFLFSITTPYLLVSLGMVLCGLYPEELNYEELTDVLPLENSVFVVLLIIALLLLSFYFIAWLFSAKRKTSLLVVALVLFLGDTLLALLFYGISFDSLIEMLFHAWIIYYLVSGIIASYKLNRLPPEENGSETVVDENIDSEPMTPEFSHHIRVADTNVKHKVFVEVSAENTPFGKMVCYRRVGKVNELVIGNYVYDEYVAVLEQPHTLTAVIDGHKVEASLDNFSRCIIKIDGKTVAKKVRLF